MQGINGRQFFLFFHAKMNAGLREAMEKANIPLPEIPEPYAATNGEVFSDQEQETHSRPLKKQRKIRRVENMGHAVVGSEVNGKGVVSTAADMMPSTSTWVNPQHANGGQQVFEQRVVEVTKVINTGNQEKGSKQPCHTKRVVIEIDLDGEDDVQEFLIRVRRNH